MTSRKIVIAIITIFTVLILSACAGANEEENTETESGTEENMDMESNNDEMDMEESDTNEDTEGMDHSGMNHSSTGEVPEGLQEADNPTYEVGSQAIIESDHMSGMNGAEATIVGAYDTTVYTVSYTPTTGGEPVENHKWVIHEEIEEAGDEPFEQGTEVTLNANHMEGMDGATAVIDSAEETTVYMVDFIATDTGEEVKNHKWVTENELSPVE